MRKAAVGARLAISLSVVIGAVVVVVLLAVAALLAGQGGHLSLQLPVRHTSSFDASGIDLPALTTRGARLQTVDGDAVVLRGVMVPDPAVLADRGRFDRDTVADVAATGANVLRVPVHPGHWADDGDYLWRYLEPLARWAGEEGLYVILDWHVIGDVTTGAAPSEPELFAATLEETRQFWTAVAGHFATAPHVLLELVNEPQGMSGDEWRAVADELTDLVREQGATQPVVVGGTEYARDLSWVADGGVADDEVVYATHLYPAHGRGGWDAWFGSVTDRYPLLLTEWGFIDRDDPGPAYLVGDTASYARPLLQRLEDEEASGWVACWWDDGWQPAMFGGTDDGGTDDSGTDDSGTDDSGTGATGPDGLGAPTTWGAFVLDQLARAAG